jgi:hypothetical protein
MPSPPSMTDYTGESILFGKIYVGRTIPRRNMLYPCSMFAFDICQLWSIAYSCGTCCSGQVIDIIEMEILFQHLGRSFRSHASFAMNRITLRRSLS